MMPKPIGWLAEWHWYFPDHPKKWRRCKALVYEKQELDHIQADITWTALGPVQANSDGAQRRKTVGSVEESVSTLGNSKELT